MKLDFARSGSIFAHSNWRYVRSRYVPHYNTAPQFLRASLITVIVGVIRTIVCSKSTRCGRFSVTMQYCIDRMSENAKSSEYRIIAIDAFSFNIRVRLTMLLGTNVGKMSCSDDVFSATDTSSSSYFVFDEPCLLIIFPMNVSPRNFLIFCIDYLDLCIIRHLFFQFGIFSSQF